MTKLIKNKELKLETTARQLPSPAGEKNHSAPKKNRVDKDLERVSIIHNHLNNPLDKETYVNEIHTELVRLKDKRHKTEKDKQREDELLLTVASIYGLQQGVWLNNIAPKGYQQEGLRAMRRSLIGDYKCKGSLELMLADKILSGYWQSLRYTSYAQNTVAGDGSIRFDQQRVNFLKEMHKGIEIANRQMLHAITMLRELKQPRLNVKVTTDNAFIAQNQQVFNKTGEAEPVEAIIKDK